MLGISKKEPAATRANVALAERHRKVHIKAPFDLRGDIDILRSKENCAFFDATFPNNEGFTDDGLFLYVHLDTPPQPLPKTFAGVPVIFVPRGPGPFHYRPRFILPRGFFVQPRQGTIADHLNYREKKDDDHVLLFKAIRQHFDLIQVPISEVIYWGVFVHIVLEDENTEKERLPSAAGHLTCMYLFEKEMMRPTMLQACHRAKDPSHVDDTVHSILRPGVRVASEYLPGTQKFVSSTLGARVEDTRGEKYTTVAAPGFPETCSTAVYRAHPDSGHVAGHVVGRIGTTGVALARLCDGVHFTNETSTSETDDEPQPLCGLRDPKQYDLAFMDSPDTGFLEGQVMGTSKRKRPSDGNTDEEHWVTNNWIYLGPDTDRQLPESMFGTVAYGEDKRVLSFVQYVFREGPWKGWCVGTSARELLERGFR